MPSERHSYLPNRTPQARDVRRVCVIGSESTGKTTLCLRLAKHFNAPWVAEYGREYSLEKLHTAHPEIWRPEEFLTIAREQQLREDAAAAQATSLLICDTDAFATELWLERYLGALPLPEGWPVRANPIDLYLVPNPDVPFVADEIRDGEHLREWMHERLIEELARRNFPYVVLSGSYQERFERAVAEIEQLVATRA